MMYERIFRPALVFLLAFGSSLAVKNGLEDKLAEDESFWGRELQAASSLPQVQPPLPPDTPATPTPPAQLPVPCALSVTIVCTVGEGIECNEFDPAGSCGLITQNFVYTFGNVGTTPFSINSYTVARNLEPAETVNFDASLQPKGTAIAVSNVQFDSCVPSVTTVTAVGNPGGCQGTGVYSFDTGQRRLTEDTAVAPTVPENNAEKEVGVAVVNEDLARRRRRTKYTRGGSRKE